MGDWAEKEKCSLNLNGGKCDVTPSTTKAGAILDGKEGEEAGICQKLFENGGIAVEKGDGNSHGCSNEERSRKSGATTNNNILVLGDGNLSFSLALSRLFPHKNIYATVFEEEGEWLEKYGELGANILAELRRNLTRIKVIFQLDATRLVEHPVQRNFFADIYFNFPHQGGKSNLKKSREFLHKVFDSVTNLMTRPGRNRFHLTLASGQSGLSPELVDNCCNFGTSDPPEHKQDSWRPLELAAEYGLVSVSVKKFDPRSFPGYKASGYLNTANSFNSAGDAHTIAFQWVGHRTGPAKMLISTAKFLEMAGQRLRTQPYEQIPPPVFHNFRPFFRYHSSIVFGPSHASKDENYFAALEAHIFRFLPLQPAVPSRPPSPSLRRCAHQLAGPFLVRMFELPEKRCVAPGGRANRIYCLQYQGVAVPLCRELANSLHEDMARRLRTQFEQIWSDICLCP